MILKKKNFGSKGKIILKKCLRNTLVSEYSMQFYYFEKKKLVFFSSGGEGVDPPPFPKHMCETFAFDPIDAIPHAGDGPETWQRIV